MQIQICYLWEEAWDSAFLTSSHPNDADVAGLLATLLCSVVLAQCFLNPNVHKAHV